MDVGVIGGGASGMFAAIMLARGGAKVTLFEKNEKLGKKLYITGKGRCNLTNACDIPALFDSVVHGKKFLRSALSTFTPADAMAFFEELGVPLTVERGNRVFPTSGKSSDVIRALAKELDRLGVNVLLRQNVTDVTWCDGYYSITAEGRVRTFDRVIVATGGVSYPSTGSTGFGYKIARSFGHSVCEPRPALAALRLREDVSSLSGVSLKNVRLHAFCDGKEVVNEFGELQFTDVGVAGPIALTASSYVTRYEHANIVLDLKPALDVAAVDARLVREFSARHNEQAGSVMRALLPAELNIYLLKRAGVSPDKRANEISKDERAAVARALKGLTFTLKSVAPFEEAVITSGGVNVTELKPSGESRLYDGLYFVGETLDVDALTGGFNLQIAWSTANAAARAILKEA